MRDLERRYRLLLRAYPAGYRAEREAEITATYLDLAGSGRRWPSPADAFDVLRGGIRERLRANGALEAAGGLRLAATVALAALGVMAGRELVLRSLAPVLPWWPGTPATGWLAVLGLAPDVAWVLAAYAALARRGAAARALAGAALALTAVAVPACVLAHVTSPPLIEVIPELALGLLALALPVRRGRASRVGPGLAVTVVLGAELPRAWWLGHSAPPGLAGLSGPLRWEAWNHFWYPAGAVSGGMAVAVALLGGTLLLGVAGALRRDNRWLWAFLLLLPAGSLLSMLAAAFLPSGYWLLWQVAAADVVLGGLACVPALLAVKLSGGGSGNGSPARGTSGASASELPGDGDAAGRSPASA